METVSQILKKARANKNLSLEQIAQSTKIRKEILEKLEAGDFVSLPGETYIKGFLVSFARCVGVEEQKILAFFRREYPKDKNKGKKLTWQPVNTKNLTLTPGNFLAGAIAILILGFLFFLAWQYKSFAGAPLLLVYEPTDQGEFTRPFVTVIGKTDPDTRLTINGEEVLAENDGAFQKTLQLENGVHVLKIIAVNKLGKSSEITRTIKVKVES